MFGQNNTQTPADNPGVAPMPLPANPFGGNDSPVPPPMAPDPLSMPPAPMPSPAPAPAPMDSAPATTTSGPDDLLNLKQKALESLQPLVSHLDQSPEDKFKTTMMLIQASDNPSLVKQAYETASQITDDKARAQALLDVVNEINYFTHKDKPEA